MMELKLTDHENYSTSVLESLNTFRKNGEFCDVKICVDTDTLHASKAVLATHSRYFRAMFSGNFQESSAGFTVVNLSGVFQRLKNVEICIDSLYRGKIGINRENIVEIFQIATYLTFDAITECCVTFIQDNLNVDNVIFYYKLVLDFHSPKLHTRILEILEARFHDVFIFRAETLDLSLEDLERLFSLNFQKHCTKTSSDYFMEKVVSLHGADLVDMTIVKNQGSSEHANTRTKDHRQCLLLASSDFETGQEDLPSNLLLAVYDISNKVWLSIGKTELPFIFTPDWKAVLFKECVVFLNHRVTVCFSVNLQTLKWSTFYITSITESMQGPLNCLLPTVQGGNILILAVSSQLIFTSNMWVKQMKYFKLTPDFRSVLVAEVSRDYHIDTSTTLMNSSDEFSVFVEGDCVFYNGQERFMGAEIFVFDSTTEELKSHRETFTTPLPAFVLIKENASLISNVDRVYLKYDHTTESLLEVSKSSDELYNLDKPANNSNACQSDLGKPVTPANLVSFNSSIWKIDNPSKYCNSLVEKSVQDKADLKVDIHPPPPFMNSVYFIAGQIPCSWLDSLDQAEFQESTVVSEL
ncbi:uncharacterized protein LOC126815818 [Patella vulgata]|uniref:uncharacterized protein LOC126815818 n=1 Tax=Patella vulgata TaxID=6465 RepID=UPI00217F2D45|nr:uncharacterized protein LOC126815818 [Patella vulgata]